MYRRYYRYNDPAPGRRTPGAPPPPASPAPTPTPPPAKPLKNAFFLDKLLQGFEKDDLILAGLLLLVLLGEEKEALDLPLILALLYLLLQK